MNDSFGDRLKKYQKVFERNLMIKTPIIIQIDGKAFHSFTKGFDTPYDDILIETMIDTTAELVKSIQGCKLGYTQSDEINLLLTDWDNFETQQYFGGRIQKIVSIVASMATAYFNRIWKKKLYEELRDGDSKGESDNKRSKEYLRKSSRIALFDTRTFNIPVHEVRNWFLWRQQDWVRNSIQMFGRAHFSHKELQNKNQNEIIKMLIDKFGLNWDTRTIAQKLGTTVYKDENNEIVINSHLKYCCSKKLMDQILKIDLL